MKLKTNNKQGKKELIQFEYDSRLAQDCDFKIECTQIYVLANSISL